MASRAVFTSLRLSSPPSRSRSAVLTRISTLPPMDAATRSTESVSVTSSVTACTRGSAAMVSNAASRRHACGSPRKTSGLPASSSARATAWPTADLPSVTSARRNFGSHEVSRSVLSSSMFGVFLSGKAIITAWPLRSSFRARRTRAPSAQSWWTCATTEGPASIRTVPTRHGRRSRKYRSLL